MSNLMTASNEWANRPDDERFWTLQECLDAAALDYKNSLQGTSRAGDLRVVADSGNLLLEGKTSRASLTNWSFGQLASRAGAPAGYLAELPATLAAQNLNHGLSKHNGEEVKILCRRLDEPTAPMTARAITSGIYSRLYDAFFLKGFLNLQERYGWRVPPARPHKEGGKTRIATEADVLKGGMGALSINVGDTIGPAGIYRGDRDMFVFMIDDNHVIEHGEDRLARGFFFWNSEVGARSFGATTFLYRSVCGNHIVWGAKTTSEIRFRHVGDRTQNRAHRILEVEVKRYLESGTQTEVQRIAAAKLFSFGHDKDEVLDFLGARKSISIPRKTLEAAFETTKRHPEDGDPRTAWGMAQGLTRLSQESRNQDSRDGLDRQAGKVLEFAF